MDDPATPEGVTRSAQPRFVQAAWIAARLNGVAVTKSFDEWSQQCFGTSVTSKDVSDHVLPLRPATNRGRPRKRPGAPRPKTPAITDSLVVDERRLRLLSLAFELPNPNNRPRPGLFEALEILPGVRHVFETRQEGAILAIAVVRDLDEADELRGNVEAEARGDPVTMRVIERESQAGAAPTWLALAQREAAED